MKEQMALMNVGKGGMGNMIQEQRQSLIKSGEAIPAFSTAISRNKATKVTFMDDKGRFIPRLLQSMTILIIQLGGKQGLGREIAFKLLHRKISLYAYV